MQEQIFLAEKLLLTKKICQNQADFDEEGIMTGGTPEVRSVKIDLIDF